MTGCEDVRVVLADHALGSLGVADDLAVRRHLRGCGACRRELDALRDGLGAFASTLERPAPAELRERVLDALRTEWEEAPRTGAATAAVPRAWALAVAASLAIAVVAGALAFVQGDRARDASRDARSYRTVLATLGGTGFRVGTLAPAGPTPVAGSVVAYESSHDQSFVVVFVRAPELVGRGAMVVSRDDGTTWEPGTIEFDGDGDAAVWWVTDRSVGSMTGLTVKAPDGTILATARIRPA